MQEEEEDGGEVRARNMMATPLPSVWNRSCMFNITYSDDPMCVPI